MFSVTWFLCCLVLTPVSAVQSAGKHYVRQDTPHGLDIIVYDSKVASATRVREVIQWVNKAGEPVGTATEDILLLPTSLAPSAASNKTEATSATTPYCTQTLVISSHGEPPANQDGSIAAPAEPKELITASKTAHSQAAKDTVRPYDILDGKNNTSERFGVSYTPYRADQGCKTQQDVDDDFKRMAGSYSIVRIYGTDCDQVPMVYSAAKTHGMQLFLGIWSPSSAQDEAVKISSGINGNWSIVHTVSVGNELVNKGEASPEDLIRSMNKARSVLRAAGYNGPVVTVDTFTAVLAHPELCDESDYCAVNAHAFFDGTILPSETGPWLQKTMSNIKSAISGQQKKIVVTETGWPTKGATNGVAVPSLENQKLALHSIKKQFASNPEDIILFSAFNDLWKKNDMSTEIFTPRNKCFGIRPRDSGFQVSGVFGDSVVFSFMSSLRSKSDE
ncbi:hypothetical protein C2857_003343 [Epichloe festucae Fl1]|uniref:Cell wall glucanase n=1 Tax=Epichloe festucae (strain Fl1) TaxID=877507 RepID=A0A7S9PS15_EPIFF|nr:hypothetical protein C2857_003343 [Epichloe festucae Fl1]